MKSLSTRWLVALLGLLVGASLARAANLDFSGNYSWQTLSASTAVIRVDRITNNSTSGTSGTIRLELWATSSAYSGGNISGYKLAQHTLSPLNAGSSWVNVSSGTIAYSAPPTGTWHVTLVVSEYTAAGSNDGFTIRDFGGFGSRLVVGSSGGSGGSNGGSGTYLQIGGLCTYTPGNNNTTVVLGVGEVRNSAANRSGSLRVELWATASPYNGGGASGHKLAQFSLSPLNAGSSYLNLNSGTLAFTPPPTGTWYVTMIVTEYDGSSLNDGYVERDFINFATPMVITGGSSGTPAAAPKIAAGTNSSFYISADGKIWAMGRNNYGDVGDGTTTSRLTPVNTGVSIASVAAGPHDFTFLVRTDGSLYATGRNEAGQLGDGTTTNRVDWTRVNSSVAAVAPGGDATLTLKTDGTLWVHGWNQFGSLGNGSTTRRLSPVQLATSVTAIAAGVDHAAFVRADGSLWTMGNNSSGQLGDGTTTARTSAVKVVLSGVSRVSAGYGHTMFVKTDGTLWGMGNNSSGQLGDGSTSSRSTPVQVATGVAAVACGQYHTLFVKTDGSLWAMGYNVNGALGDGTTTSRSTPVRILSSGVSAVAGGAYHSVFRRTDGTVWGMGANLGSLGDGTTTSRTTPVQLGVAAGSGSGGGGSGGSGGSGGGSGGGSVTVPATTLVAGVKTSYIVKSDGTLWSVGNNIVGQLGDGTTTHRSTPVQVATGVTSAYAAISRLFFIKSDGSLWATGYNGYGALGDGSTANRSTPAQVATGVAGVAMSLEHTVFLKSDGSLWGMGDNSSGELGDGTTTNRSTPVAIATGVRTAAVNHGNTFFVKSDGGLWTSGALTGAANGYRPVQAGSGVSHISAGIFSTSYLKSDGTLWGFGTVSDGIQGAPSIGSTYPTTVQYATGVAALAVADASTVFLKTDGTITGYQVRAANSGNHNNVVQHSAIPQTPAAAGRIFTGKFHTLILKPDGTLWGMGDNSAGQLGDGTTTFRPTPVQIATGVVAAAAGWDHSIFQKSDGTYWAMGSNENGQLGDGTTTNRLTPVQMALTGGGGGSGGSAGTAAVVQRPAPGGSASFSVSLGSTPPSSAEWHFNDRPTGTSGSTLSLAGVRSEQAGLYIPLVSSTGAYLAEPRILGLSSTSKVVDTGTEVGINIRHPNGNTYDQVLLTGSAVTITADAGQVTRTSFLDLDGDIVQVEFSGAGSLTINLRFPDGPKLPAKYNQSVNYMDGLACLTITGADETTNVSIFTVGRMTAVNQALFRTGVSYGGIADVAFIAISSTNGRFGGIRASNASFLTIAGPVGIYAPGVTFTGPVYVGNITAADTATPMLRLGSASDVRITGGSLNQLNSRAVEVSGITQLRFTAGQDSHGNTLTAQANQARLVENGVDVTSRIVVNP